MARNGSGTYSLPAGNPVVTGTTIQSTWANTTLSDIATALTQSLSQDGQTPVTANLPMGGFKLTGLAAGTTAGDSVRYEQFASPPAIGGTAAAAGSFTTLSASSTVSGTGFSTYLASPPAIGGTAPAAGSFTTLNTSGNVTLTLSSKAAPVAADGVVITDSAASGIAKVITFSNLAASATPSANSGSGAVGTALLYAREDHVHPETALTGAITTSGATASIVSVTAGSNYLSATSGSVADGSGALHELCNVRIQQSGTYRVVLVYSGGDGYYSRVYKNGAAFGTYHNTGPNSGGGPVTYSEDLAFTVGDTVQLFAANYSTTASLSGSLTFRVDTSALSGKACIAPVSIPVGER